MNNFNPLVSIIIPVYNGSNYLSEAIDSALAQTYDNIEIIVVNDGSNDDGKTEKIALSYGDKIKYYHKENGGVSSALNLGISKMQGDYFSWLSHDDLYYPDKIEQEINSTTTNDDIVLCSGELIDKNKKKMHYRIKKLYGRYSGVELFKHFLNGYQLNGLGFLIPKKIFEIVGVFDEKMRFLQDTDLWIRMMQNQSNKFVCLSKTLVVTRVHQQQTTNTSRNIYEIDKTEMAKKHICLLSNLSDHYSDKLLQLYYLLFVKDNNKAGKVLAKNELKKRRCYSLLLLIQGFVYCLKGTIKRALKRVYMRLLKIKKLRGEIV